MSKPKGCDYRLDLIGQRFGKWEVLAKHPKRSKSGWVLWECKCSGCGSTHLVGTGNLRSGATTQCQACAYKPGNRKEYHGHKIEYMGESLTRGEWAKKLGLTRAALYTRFSKGWTLERILSTPKLCPRENRCKLWITVGDKTLTIPQWAEKLGISHQAIRLRIEKGMAPEQAVTLSRQVARGGYKPRKLFTIQGKQRTAQDMADELGLTLGGMWCRLRRYKLDDPRLLAPRHSGHTGRPKKNNKKEK